MPTNDRPVPTEPTTEERVLDALSTYPGSTVAEIATAAAVGKSTAGKILAALEQSGRAQRTPGTRNGGHRTPDRWTPVALTTATGRLGRGALRKMVADYLQAHPGTEFGPVAIGKALDRSSGAVANALTKLVGDGTVEQTRESPARYAAVVDTDADANGEA